MGGKNELNIEGDGIAWKWIFCPEIGEKEFFL